MSMKLLASLVFMSRRRFFWCWLEPSSGIILLVSKNQHYLLRNTQKLRAETQGQFMLPFVTHFHSGQYAAPFYSRVSRFIFIHTWISAVAAQSAFVSLSVVLVVMLYPSSQSPTQQHQAGKQQSKMHSRHLYFVLFSYNIAKYPFLMFNSIHLQNNIIAYKTSTIKRVPFYWKWKFITRPFIAGNLFI